ncbi:hypothetical protein J3R73_001072 [Labrys monachus]|uniref:Uncharacterized protein n=1 Tax=Labrys monachus TaxID=217067 RepID=A0ABU0F9L4_9HYPH|nr:hypothetical protein [Labrys monachus]
MSKSLAFSNAWSLAATLMVCVVIFDVGRPLWRHAIHRI